MENPNLKWMIWGYPHDLGNLEKMEVCPWENPEVAGIWPSKLWIRWDSYGDIIMIYIYI